MLDAYLSDATRRDWADQAVEGTIRFAVIGVGWWTREEAVPAIVESEYCETTVAVSSSSEKAADAVAETDTVEHGLTYSEFEAGEATDAYDAVYVCTPNGTHLEHVAAAAEHGKAVLCEKPMEATVERARDLRDACRAADVPLMVAYRMQTEPLVRRAAELIADGAIGDVVQVHSDDSAMLLDIFPDPDQWRLDPELAGGCALMDLGIYPLNTLRYLLQADPVAVTGTTRSTHEAFADVDESVWFELQFEDDVGALCTASHRAYGTSNIRIVGREGLIELRDVYHPWADRSLIVEVGGDRARIAPENVNQMTEEFDYFAHCLLTDTDPVPDGEHGLFDMVVLDRIYEAAESGSVVEIPEDPAA